MDLEQLYADYGSVEELDIDDTFLDHMAERAYYAKHAVTVEEVNQVLEIAPKFFLNNSSGGTDKVAPLYMIGITAAQRVVMIPLVPAGRLGVWRPVTAFEANAGQRRRYMGEYEAGGALT